MQIMTLIGTALNLLLYSCLICYKAVTCAIICEQVDEAIQSYISPTIITLEHNLVALKILTVQSQLQCSHRCRIQRDCDGVFFAELATRHNCKLFSNKQSLSVASIDENSNQGYLQVFVNREKICSIEPVVHGSWSSWAPTLPPNGTCPGSNTGLCTRVCDGGQKYEIRSCTNPAPANGGLSCGTHDARWLPCNEASCPVAIELAYNKPCIQSSTYTVSHYAGCDNTNDGDENSNFGAGRSCSLTNWQNNPWWQVDLGGLYYISRVMIVRRGECCADRFDQISIFTRNTSDANDPSIITCQENIMTTPEITRTFTCDCPAHGRYLVVKREVSYGPLEICEVKVYGSQL